MTAIGKLSAPILGPRKPAHPRDGANQERAHDGPSLKIGEHTFRDVRRVVLDPDLFKATQALGSAGKPAGQSAEVSKAKTSTEGAERAAASAAEAARSADKVLERAMAITANNGVDEIFFRTRNGDLYVAAFRGSAEGVRIGYLGRYDGERVEVVHVDDESNTFREGLTDIFTWTRDSFGKAAGQEATKAVGTVAGTIVGGLIAAAAVKGSATPVVTAAATGAATNAAAVAVGNAATQVVQTATAGAGTAAGAAAQGAVASAATQAGAAATEAAAAGTEAAAVNIAGKVGGAAVRTVGTARAAIGAAFSTVAKIAIPMVAVGGVVFGLGSLVGGWNAHRKKADFHTIDMITGEY